jgi:hypothetical protein
MPRIIGTLLKVETKSGTDDNGTPYSYQRAHVLDGVEVINAKVAEDFPLGTLPAAQSQVDFQARITAYKNSRTGEPTLSYLLLDNAKAE